MKNAIASQIKKLNARPKTCRMGGCIPDTKKKASPIMGALFYPCINCGLPVQKEEQLCQD